MNKEPLYIYDSLSQSKLKFKPVNPGYVGLYVCGPTVYNHVHLGNVRTFISFDVIYRYLQYLGYKVRYVRNITDAGHLENDADEGEDRISKRARLEQLEPMEVVQRYTIDFHHILKRFNCLSPSIEPTATGHIIEQIELINNILDKGFAYEKNGSVYFDVITFNNVSKYGKLSNRDIEDLIHNTRKLEGQSQKKNPQDFALWKRAEPQHIMRWPSPWGEGFPGWHLECTAMSTKYLGIPFDIHGGGMDLKFPHHECEIAQAESLHGKPPVNYWVHTNMLTLNGQKMSKSTGNNVLPSELFSGNHPLLSRSYPPEVLRFFMLQAHYRSVLDFSNEAIIASEKGYLKLIYGLNQIKNIKPNTESTWNLDKWKAACFSALNDDFNTPILIAQLFEATKVITKLDLGILTLNHNDLRDFKQLFNDFITDVLGLKSHAKQSNSETINQNLMELILTLRNEARTNKDFKTSDLIRNQLKTMGIQINDTPKGTDYTITK